jgi:hypothetical protein
VKTLKLLTVSKEYLDVEFTRLIYENTVEEKEGIVPADCTKRKEDFCY